MKAFVKKLFDSSEPSGAVAMTPAEERKFRLEGLRVVLGGALVHFVLGCFYLWGGISLYVASYLIKDDPNIDVDLVKLVFPFMNLTLCFGMPFGIKIADRIGGKLLILLGIIAIAVMTLITSYSNSFYTYLILYGLGVGLVSGFLYVVTITFGWKYFPHRKGFVSGAILAGYGFGPLTFNFIALACVNPNNLKASVKIGSSSYFTHEVYDNVPYMMRILALCYLLIGILGWLLIKVPKVVPLRHQPVPQQQPVKTQNNLSHRTSAEVDVGPDGETRKLSTDNNSPVNASPKLKAKQSSGAELGPLSIAYQQTNTESNLVKEEDKKAVVVATPAVEPVKYECQSVSQGLKTLPFWLLLGMAFFGTFYGFLMANNYKVYGLLRLNDDTFVTTVGSIGSAANGCSRIFWATLLDKFGYKKVFVVLMVIQIVINGTLHSVSEVKALYLIWYAISMACEGGVLAMEPAVTGKIFGAKKGSLIYGFVFFGMAMANLCSFFLTKFALKTLGWPDIFWICFAFSCVALVINFFFNQNYKFPPPKHSHEHKHVELAVKV